MREQEIFAAAIHLTGPAREAFIEQACALDETLKRNVVSLLASHDETGGVIPRSPEFDGAATLSARETIGAGVMIAGRYKLIEQIGEGGMGSVWLAEQKEPVKRKVALKLVKAGMDSRAVLVRFEAERQALALMDHPNIAKVLDGGLHEGLPFFVMELVKGIPITEYCDAQRLTPLERLRLFIPVCDAVQHAHQKGIIHRDIKPRNVLVALYDDKPIVKVIDFGIAKATGGALTEQTLETGFGQVVGTPQYMSPEQATFNNLDIDTRSDIYTLGVLLYELLTGSPPFTQQTLERAGLFEMLRVVREEEPQRPSTRISTAEALPTLSANRNTEPNKLTGLLKHELDWIVMKALEKDRVRRYQTASGFAADVQRYLDGETVLAHPPSPLYRLKKWTRKHQGKVVAATLVLLSLIGGLAGTYRQYVRAREAMKHAVLQRSIAEANAAKARQAVELEATAREMEISQRLRAEQANQKAAEILQAMVSGVTGDSLATQVTITPEQKKFLTMALSYYQELASDMSDDMSNSARIAIAGFQVGLIESRLERKAEAVTAFTESSKRYAVLAEKHPNEPYFQSQLALCLNNIAIQLNDLGKTIDAERTHLEAIAQQEKLVQNFPGTEKHQQDLALSFNNLGALYQKMNRTQDATSNYEKALALREELTAAHPGKPSYRRDLAKTHNHLGILLRKQSKLSEADLHYTQALSLRRQLLSEYPSHPDYRNEYAASLNNVANLAQDQKQIERSEKNYGEAVAISEKLVKEYPSVVEYRTDLVTSSSSLALLLSRKGNTLGSDELIRKNVEHLRFLIKEQTSNEAYREQLSVNLVVLADNARKKKKLAEAEEHYREVISIWPPSSNLPLSTKAQLILGNVHAALADLSYEQNIHEECLKWCDQAIVILLSLKEKEPASVKSLLGAYSRRARVKIKLGQNAEALSDWDLAIELGTKDQVSSLKISRAIARLRIDETENAFAEMAEIEAARNWNMGTYYGAACFYAIASEKVPDRQQDFSDRAVAYLAKSIANGFRDGSHLNIDPDLDPIRQREDFKKLLESFRPTNQ